MKGHSSSECPLKKRGMKCFALDSNGHKADTYPEKKLFKWVIKLNPIIRSLEKKKTTNIKY